MWCWPSGTRCGTVGWLTPISSAVRGGRARPQPPGSWPGRSTARTCRTVSPAGCVSPASRSPRAPPSTSTSWTQPPTTGWRPCGTWCPGPPWVRRDGRRCTSSTRSTCCPPRRPTHCSRPSKSLRPTSCSCSPPPTPRRCCPPYGAAPSTLSSGSSGPRSWVSCWTRCAGTPASTYPTRPWTWRCDGAGARPATPSRSSIRWPPRTRSTTTCPSSTRWSRPWPTRTSLGLWWPSPTSRRPVSVPSSWPVT